MHNDQPAAQAMTAGVPSPALRWLEEHGDALYAFAIRRVRRAEAAEDLVQETLLAALSASTPYAGRSAERTWLIGVMKHKLIDHLRKTFREQGRGDLEGDGSADFFDHRGRWKIKVSAWPGDPGERLEKDEFRAALETCLSRLPARLAQVFWLREAEEMESEWVCRELRISRANLWAMMHRARLGLRRCLSINWFGGDKQA